jgi:predicted KAP-like P-loop ATPase
LKSSAYHMTKPDRESKLFQFDKFAKQLANLILDDKLHTPYAIAIPGEWGEGKTSLIGQAHDLLISAIKEQNKDWKVLWFDAWEYERLDPVAALLQRIAHLYAEGERNRHFKEAIKGLASFFPDIVLRSATQLTLKEVQEHFKSSIEQTPAISEKLSEMIAEGRLIVFVDDLGRCHVENALGILEAVKLFLNAEGAIFVVAVDMKNLKERGICDIRDMKWLRWKERIM